MQRPRPPQTQAIGNPGAGGYGLPEPPERLSWPLAGLVIFVMALGMWVFVIAIVTKALGLL